MEHMYWYEWYSGWDWFLWFGVGVLLVSSFGNWSYSRSAHEKYDRHALRSPMDTLNQRYANGEIEREEYLKMKSEIYYSNP